MTDIEYAEERNMDARFEAHQDRLADEADERDLLGFAVGDRVTVGKGRTEWVVESFSTAAATGEILAHLQPTAGYTGTTVTVDRLRNVMPDQRLGFVEGEKVTVGAATVAFIITGFGMRANGQHYAELERADGTSRFHELANVDRLKRVA